MTETKSEVNHAFTIEGDVFDADLMSLIKQIKDLGYTVAMRQLGMTAETETDDEEDEHADETSNGHASPVVREHRKGAVKLAHLFLKDKGTSSRKEVFAFLDKEGYAYGTAHWALRQLSVVQGYVDVHEDGTVVWRKRKRPVRVAAPKRRKKKRTAVKIATQFRPGGGMTAEKTMLESIAEVTKEKPEYETEGAPEEKVRANFLEKAAYAESTAKVTLAKVVQTGKAHKPSAGRVKLLSSTAYTPVE